MIGTIDGTNNNNVITVRSASGEHTNVEIVSEEYGCVCVRVGTRGYAWVCGCVRMYVHVYACTPDMYPWVGQADACGRL